MLIVHLLCIRQFISIKIEYTGFITVTYDISNLRGSYVKLMFEVEDSGDNTYETAVLIDEISLAK